MAIPVRAFAVIGLGFGDESKGSTVDFLTRLHKAKLVVRFNGGCQAAHTVVEPNGRWHTFAQFGSGALAGAATYLGPGMLVEPFSLITESNVLHKKGIDALASLSIDPDSVITTPYHEIVNRAKEHALGDKRHGSCGRGIGETRSDELQGLALRMRDLRSCSLSKPILKEIQALAKFKLRELGLSADEVTLCHEGLSTDYDYFRSKVRVRRFDEVLAGCNTPAVIFEGSQGLLLDEKHGFAPYNSWTDCTFAGAENLCSMGGWGISLTKIGCLRAYSTRHGAGPFVAESDQVNFHEAHNGHGPWQGRWRQGHFDMVMAKYAISCVGGIDELAISHLDHFSGPVNKPWGCVDYYRQIGTDNIEPITQDGLSVEHLSRFKKGPVIFTETPVQDISRWLMPIKYASYGPTHLDKKVLD